MPGPRRSASKGPRSLLGALAVPLGAGLVFWALEALASLWLFRAMEASGPALLAGLGNLLACLRFGQTLLPGEEPLISRYSRHDMAGLADRCGAYTRRLTMVWFLVLAAFAALFLLAAYDIGPAGPLSRLEPVVLVTLFLGEHLLRSRCFPELGRVTPLRTVRAILLSHRRARHAH